MFNFNMNVVDQTSVKELHKGIEIFEKFLAENKIEKIDCVPEYTYYTSTQYEHEKFPQFRFISKYKNFFSQEKLNALNLIWPGCYDDNPSPDMVGLVLIFTNGQFILELVNEDNFKMVYRYSISLDRLKNRIETDDYNRMIIILS